MINKLQYTVDSYAGFAIDAQTVWINPAADLSTLPEFLLHEILHCTLENLKHEGLLMYADEDEENIVKFVSKAEVEGLKLFFCRPKIRKDVLKKINAARQRLSIKEEWKCQKEQR